MDIPVHEKALNTAGNVHFRWIYGLLLCSLSALSLNAGPIILGTAGSYSVLARLSGDQHRRDSPLGRPGGQSGISHHGISSRSRARDDTLGGCARCGRSDDALTAYNALAG